MLQDFAVRFWGNTHPVEKAQWGIEAGTELILNLLLLIFTAGVGTTANIAAKSGRLIKLAKLLERVAGVLKRVKSHARLPKLRKGPAGGGPKTKTKPGAKGREQPKTPEKSTDIDGRDKNGYGNDSDGAKKKPEPKPKAKQKPNKDQKRPTKLDVEEATRLRAQSQLGRELKHADNPRIEWVDDAGRTYNQMGNPNMIPHLDKQRTQFLKQIDRHLKKADHPVIDLTDFPRNIIDDVSGYIGKLPADQAARIIKIGF